MSAKPQTLIANPISYLHYRDLPTGLYQESAPSEATAPALIELNVDLLQELGVDDAWFRSPEGLSVMSGNAINDANKPISMAYSGHQFGHWVPSLGDGRAHMIGQMIGSTGSITDVQLKGSGRTPYSRGGDGRATLGSVLREYLVSEAMAGLGIPTTRSLAVIGTGQPVMREQALPGAILVRTASSHLRVGTFQYASAHLETKDVQALADFALTYYFPERLAQPYKYLELLDAVVERQATLIAQWMLVGFIHGVMNTDNMSIVGETIDYGPCAFMDEFHPNKVFSSIDQAGRYAWAQQPSIGYWNLTQFVQSLLPLLHPSEGDAESMAKELLDEFIPQFGNAFKTGLLKKLGVSENAPGATDFVDATIKALAESGMDFTVFFNRLTRVATGEPKTSVLELFGNQRNGAKWLQDWNELRSDARGVIDDMRRANPAVIARNHRVEEAIDAAVDDQNFDPFRRLCRVLANPFHVDQADLDLQNPPTPEERVTRTFCGT